MNKGILYILALLAITNMVFAGTNPCDNPNLSCVDAVKSGCLTGSITGGAAKVTNNAVASYNVGLAIYKVFDAADHDTTLEHQVLFDLDTGTVGAKSKMGLSVDLPGCQYQIDLFCGNVIQSFAGGVRYNDRKLDYHHKTTGSFCTQTYCGDGIKNGAEECDGTDGVSAHQSCTSNCIIVTSPPTPTPGTCYQCTTFPDVTANSMWTTNGDGTITIRTTLSTNFVDNTYGTNAIGWPNGHKFSDLTGSDELTLALYDATNVKRMEFQIDYLTANSGVPSGYKTLCVNGGDGKMTTGSAADVVGCLTSLDVNFNTFGYVLTTNSPATNANYTPNPTNPNWIYKVWYEVTVKPGPFMAGGGFGKPIITNIHASPSKKGKNTCPTVVVSCPFTPTCGDGAINQASETCELPSISNNAYCTQSTTQCSGTKQGTRDTLGNCNSACGCTQDTFNYACTKGQCGAACATNTDCNDNNANTIDTCDTATCACTHTTTAYCGDGIINDGEECDGTAGVTAHHRCTDQCELEYVPYCGDNILDTNEQCDDGSDNGVECNPLCDDECDYCSDKCTTETESGESCPPDFCELHPNDPSCGGNPGVPEFPLFTLGLAIVGAGLGLAFLRKK